LFKGEENLNVFNNPDALKYLIETFSNIQQFDPYYTGDDDRQGFIDYAVEQSRKAYERAMRSDSQNSQQEKALKSEFQAQGIYRLGPTLRLLGSDLLAHSFSECFMLVSP